MDELKLKLNVGTAIARGLVSQLPVLGPIANEIIGQVLPDRRIERLTSMFDALEARVSDLEPATVRNRFTDPIYVDLLEESMFQGARASSPERIGYIAEVVARGVRAADAARLDRLWLLRLLGEVNDAEVLRLILHGKRATRSAFYEMHKDALEIPSLYFGEHAPEKAAKATVRESYDGHLERLELLRRRYHASMRGEPTRHGEDGRPKAHSWLELSGLGYLLLREIGQPADIDPHAGTHDGAPSE